MINVEAKRMTDLPKQTWCYIDGGFGALWHQPTHPADEDALPFIRRDLIQAILDKHPEETALRKDIVELFEEIDGE
jgi:hypothetical protein